MLNYNMKILIEHSIKGNNNNQMVIYIEKIIRIKCLNI